MSVHTSTFLIFLAMALPAALCTSSVIIDKPEMLLKIIDSLVKGNFSENQNYELDSDLEFSLESLGLPKLKIKFSFLPLSTTECSTRSTSSVTTTDGLTPITKTTECPSPTTESTKGTTAKPRIEEICNYGSLNKSSVIIGGCNLDLQEESIKESEVWTTKGNKFLIPEYPTESCSAGASVYFQGKIVHCYTSGRGLGDSNNINCVQTEPDSEFWDDFPSPQRKGDDIVMASTTTYIAIAGLVEPYGAIEVFKNGTWRTSIIIEELERIVNYAVVGFGDHWVWIIGGETIKSISNNVYQLQLESGDVNEVSPLPEGRFGHAATTYILKGIMYVVVAGGYTEDLDETDSVVIIEVCNVDGFKANKNWSSLPKMKFGRSFFGLGVTGGSLAAFGGIDDSKNSAYNTEFYDEEENRWINTGGKIIDREFFSIVSF